MKPVNPAFEDDDIQQSLNQPGSSDADLPAPSDLDDIQLSSLADSPLERLKLRYARQLNKDIERLEATKAALQTDIDALQAECDQLAAQLASSIALSDGADGEPTCPELRHQPRLPGESEASMAIPVAQRPGTPLELPIPATSEQRRQQAMQLQQADADVQSDTLRRGLVLSAIATILIAWHYGIVAALGQGGSWLGLPIGELGAGFVPAVALLWLRMLVMIPALVFLAPQLYQATWEDLQSWVYTRDQITLLLVVSGLALFLSQAFIYQSISLIGAPIGATLLFLYPLTVIPLGAVLAQETKITQVGLLAIVAIAMGGLLTARPAFTSVLNSGLDTGLEAGSALPSTAIWLGVLASVCFSFYIVMTNTAYRQQCHPIPTAIVQFSVVAVLSSFILLMRPLELPGISWLGFAGWGIVLGIAMLLVYLVSYGSLRLIGARTGAIAAAVPLVTLVIAWFFTPQPSLEIIQWTGILLVSVGGIALGNEKGE
ncbi:MAG: hypothetical protein DCF25_19285 [Leptolyngbya foveolarum]|uniref:EamA domain-containing protein n=1 Tax=Leptolyngbya foveolarum TaxID=47253 RepID=A0A2W4VH32_9CYAN|nr:MAG: hypothetical protein DCF25_19285 [Leptolyngbya foveolarum]